MVVPMWNSANGQCRWQVPRWGHGSHHLPALDRGRHDLVRRQRLGPELAAPAGQVLMDYQRNGDEWRRGYPAGTPGLETCWRNFARCAEPMLRQAARLEPVPWREALHEPAGAPAGRRKLLAGRSTALAVRGAGVEPADIDLVCSGDGARRLGVIFAERSSSQSPMTGTATSAITGAVRSRMPGSNGSVIPRPASTHPRRPTSGPSRRPGLKP